MAKAPRTPKTLKTLKTLPSYRNIEVDHNLSYFAGAAMPVPVASGAAPGAMPVPVASGAAPGATVPVLVASGAAPGTAAPVPVASVLLLCISVCGLVICVFAV